MAQLVPAATRPVQLIYDMAVLLRLPIARSLDLLFPTESRRLISVHGLVWRGLRRTVRTLSAMSRARVIATSLEPEKVHHPHHDAYQCYRADRNARNSAA